MGDFRCRTRSELRSEEGVARKPSRYWESLGLCRWRQAHLGQPLVRRAILRRRARQLLSMRKKSPTLVCRLSMSSTTKTPEPVVPTYNLPRGHPVDRGKVAEAAQTTAQAEAPRAAQAAQPVGRGAADYRPWSVSARPRRIGENNQNSRCLNPNHTLTTTTPIIILSTAISAVVIRAPTQTKVDRPRQGPPKA
jgi:hypothetical protein